MMYEATICNFWDEYDYIITVCAESRDHAILLVLEQIDSDTECIESIELY